MALKSKSSKKQSDINSKYAVGYRRCSTEDQIDRESLETQSKLIRKYCLDNNLTLITIFEDLGISGLQTETRQGYLDMLNIIKPGYWIIMYELSRFGRDQAEVTSIYKELTQKGYKFIVIAQDIDSRNDDAEMKIGLYATFAQRESRTTSNRVKANMERLKEEGSNVYRCPYGWLRDPHTRRFDEDPESQFVLRELIQLNQDGICDNKIATILNDRGYGHTLNNNKKTKITDPKFTHTTVRLILDAHGHGNEIPEFTMHERIDNWNAKDHTKRKGH